MPPTAPAIRLLRNPNNIGVIPTLQRGLEAARGKYVYFAASDDWVFPGFFALALRRLEADPDIGLFCGEAMLIDGGKQSAVRRAARGTAAAARRADRCRRREDLLRSTDNWILTGSAIFRRDCVTWAGGFDARLGSFADGFIARKVALKYGFLFEPEIVASWVVFPDSVSRKTALDLQRTKYILDVVPTPDRRRSRLPVLVRGRVPRPLAVRRVPPGAPGRSDRRGRSSSNWARVPPPRRPNWS